MNNRLFIITGDASGDIHGSYVVKQFLEHHPEIEIQAVGGEKIAETGVEIFHHQRKMGVFGSGIIGAIPSHFQLGNNIIRHLKQWRPDAVLLIDYGVFNLWISRKLNQLGIKVFYYIPPQVWASRRRRLKTIQRYVHHVFCIFPFEQALYESKGIPVTYVGHPILEQLAESPDRNAFCQQYGLDPQQPIIGIFPGSRRSEVKNLLRPMLMAMRQIHEQHPGAFQFVLAQSTALPETFFAQVLQQYQTLTSGIPLTLLQGENHSILALSQAAMVASGTVTLEAALYRTPVVITYQISPLAMVVYRCLAYIRQIGLPNILAGETFLPEFLKTKITAEDITQGILPFLSDDSPQSVRAKQLFEKISQDLGQGESASLRVMETILNLLATQDTVKIESPLVRL